MWSNIQAVVFDLDGTLLDRRESFERFVRRQHERLSDRLGSVPADRYVELLIHLDQDGYSPRRQVFADLTTQLGLPAELADVLRDDYRAGFPGACRLFPDAASTLGALRASGYKLGLITNGSSRMQSRKVECLALEPMFDALVISASEGIHKPDPEIFRRALTRLQVDAANAVYVGDRPDVDIDGARAAGMRTVWRRDVKVQEPVAADAIVDEVGELLALLTTRIPDWLEPMAATLTQDRFTGPDWLFERKFDGIRLLAYKSDRGVRLYSRNQNERQIPVLAEAIAALPAHELILDGELAWDQSGQYHVFDILWLNGRPVTSLPLEERRALLQQLMLKPPLRPVDLVEDDKPWERAAREGWEGVVAKRRGSTYEHRRSKHWLKMKCELAQELVVGGFTDPQGARVGLGALLVGYYEGDDFVFAGKLGTGFDATLLRELRSRLDALEVPKAPFTKGTGLPRLRAHWVKPEVVVQAGFIEWTGHGKLRHPRLLGVRFDKNARDVVRESQ